MIARDFLMLKFLSARRRHQEKHYPKKSLHKMY